MCEPCRLLAIMASFPFLALPFPLRPRAAPATLRFGSLPSMEETTMCCRTGIASMLLLGIAVLPALAFDKCPSETRQADEIIKAIRDAPACWASFYVMKDCRFSDGSDAQLARAVIERCEATFLDHMSPDRRYLYQRAQERCARKFANRPGAIYASYQATCEAAVAARYAWWWGY
jgi:hypothetical protein